MIREIRQDDKETFMEMAKKFYSSPAVSHNVGEEIIVRTFEAAVNKSPYIRAFILEDSGTAVGFGLISFTFATEVGGLAVLLEDLYLDESCRGKGLGSKFMQFIENEFPSAERFRLEVAKENTRAIDLYEKLGYKTLDYVQMIKEK